MKDNNRFFFRQTATAAACLAVATSATPAWSAFDCFLKVEGIPGQSTDAKHKDWIDCLTYSTGASNSGSTHIGGGVGSGTAEEMPFVVSKFIDKATPKLFFAAASGSHIPEVSLELLRPGTGQKVMQFIMSNVLVTSVDNTNSLSGDRLFEEITFEYGKIEWSYTEYDPATGAPKGSITSYWDLVLNKGG